MKKLVLVSVVAFATAAVAQTLPAGTPLRVKLENTLSTFGSKTGDPFSGRVTEAVTVDGKTVIPVGTTVQGRVTKVNEPRRIAGKPTIAIFPETIVLPSGEHYMLNAPLIDTNLRNGTDVNTEGQFKGAGHDGKDLTEIGFGRRDAPHRLDRKRPALPLERKHDRWTRGRGQGAADWWDGWCNSHRRSLVGKKEIRNAAGGNGVVNGAEPSAVNGRGQRGTVALQNSRRASLPIIKCPSAPNRSRFGASPGQPLRIREFELTASPGFSKRLIDSACVTLSGTCQCDGNQ